MRSSAPAFALALALAFVGCTGNDGDPPATTTPVTTTPDATPPTTTTPEATPPVTTTPEPTATTPAPTPELPPFVNITVRHDFANASENLTFTIPEGYEGLNVTVQFDAAPSAVPGQSACAGALRIKVVRPDGSLQHDALASPTTGAAGTHCGVTSASTGQLGTDVPPGQWHADFSGNGVGIGWVFVTQG